MKNIVLVIFLYCFSFTVLLAHEEVKPTEISKKSWYLEKTHTNIKGSFLMTQNGKVYFDNDQEIISYDISVLTPKDQELIYAQIDASNNSKYTAKTYFQEDSTFTTNWKFAGLFILAIATIMIASFTKNLKYVLLPYAAIVLITLISVCSNFSSSEEEQVNSIGLHLSE